jgi:hypothetical protein
MVPSTGSPHQDHLTSATPLTARPRSTIGSTRTDCGTRRIRITKSREPKFTWSKGLLSAATYLESRLLWLPSIIKWSQGQDTSEIPTRSWISVSYPLVKSCRHLGTENLSSLEDLLTQKLKTLTHSLIIPSSIKHQSLPSQMLVTQASLCALPSALTWGAFQYPILEHTKDGFACAMVQCMINSEESDKDLLKITCLILTTLSMDQQFALKNKSSPTSHQSSCTFETLISEYHSLSVWRTLNFYLNMFKYNIYL